MLARLLIIACLGLTVGLWARPSQAAVLAPAPLSGPVTTNETVRISIVLDSEGEHVNALETAVTYPPSLLTLLSVERGESAFPLWIEEPQINPALGRVSLTMGAINGLVTKNAPVATLVFRARLTGTATIGVDQTVTHLLLADGAGTPATVTTEARNISITHPNPDAPTLRSPSHPKQDQWSAVRDVVMEWMPYKDLFVSYRLSNNATDVPDEIAEDNRGQIIFPALTDGHWYFTLRTRFAGKPWSPVARYQLLIDGTVPEPSLVALEQESSTGHWLLLATASDSPAGLARTELRTERTGPAWWPIRTHSEWRTIESPLDLGPTLPVGQLSVRFVDAAGNSTLVTIPAAGKMPVTAMKFFIVVGALLMLGLLWVRLQSVRRRPNRRTRR